MDHGQISGFSLSLFIKGEKVTQKVEKNDNKPRMAERTWNLLLAGTIWFFSQFQDLLLSNLTLEMIQPATTRSSSAAHQQPASSFSSWLSVR